MAEFRRSNRWETLTGWTIAVVCLTAASADAGEPRDVERQTREFKISVDGTARGSSTVQFRRRDDGTDSIQGESEVRVTVLAHRYAYKGAGSEVWQGGRLIAKDNSADYNGKRYLVKAISAPNGLQVTVNGVASQVDAEAWVTSYWQLPERLLLPGPTERTADATAAESRRPEKAESRIVTLLDSDRGRILRGELQCVGEDAVMVAGRPISCTHYRITGDVQVDVWYDASRRLVRQESLEWRHKTVLELTRIADA